MKRNKFFNDDLSSGDEKKVTLGKKIKDGEIDRNNPFVKLFLIILGLFCLTAFIYYIFTWVNM